MTVAQWLYSAACLFRMTNCVECEHAGDEMCMANPIISSKAAGKWGLKRHSGTGREGVRVPWIISYRKTHFLSLDLPTHLQGISLLFKCSAGMTHLILQMFNDAVAVPQTLHHWAFMARWSTSCSIFFLMLRFSAFEKVFFIPLTLWVKLWQSVFTGLWQNYIIWEKKKHFSQLTLTLELAVDFK